MKSVFILGAGEMQVPVIQECRRLGHRIVLADQDVAAPGMALADRALALSTNDLAGVLRVARDERVDGILTTSDFPVRTVAHVCRHLGLAGLSEAAAAIATDKFLQRETLSARGLLCPRYVLVGAAETWEKAAAALRFPVVVKPIDSSASRGVSRVDDAAGLRAACDLARSFSRGGSVLVEEWIDGPEFSVEVLVQRGTAHILALTEKTTAGDAGRFFVEARHVIPALVSVEDAQRIKAAVTAAIRAVGMDECGAHVEIKLSSRGPAIIELAARLGGDYIASDLVPLATGVPMLANVIRIALGENVQVTPDRSDYSGVQFVTPETHDAAAANFARLEGDPRVKRSLLKPKPAGATLRSSLDRLGYCIACAPDRTELLGLLDQARGG